MSQCRSCTRCTRDWCCPQYQARFRRCSTRRSVLAPCRTNDGAAGRTTARQREQKQQARAQTTHQAQRRDFRYGWRGKAGYLLRPRARSFTKLPSYLRQNKDKSGVVVNGTGVTVPCFPKEPRMGSNTPVYLYPEVFYANPWHMLIRCPANSLGARSKSEDFPLNLFPGFSEGMPCGWSIKGVDELYGRATIQYVKSLQGPGLRD